MSIINEKSTRFPRPNVLSRREKERLEWTSMLDRLGASMQMNRLESTTSS
jgi:hypothetical protein